MEGSVEFPKLFELATGWAPFPWQHRLATIEHLPEVVRVPTGTGKTEGATLGWLWRRRYAPPEVRAATPRRLVYCLPMRVLVEQTIRRVTQQLERLGVEDVPVHQLMGGAVSRDWTRRPEDEAILVGTLDQLVSRALMRGYGVSRHAWPLHYALLHNDALWVFDEVQLMGEALATSAQLDGLRTTFPRGVRPTTSVWMSATVDPAWLESVDRRAPERILELQADDRRAGLGPRLAAGKPLVRVAELDASTVMDAHRPGTLTLVVLNTVARARDLYRAIARATRGTGDTLLLHSRFRPDDRRVAVARLDGLGDPAGAGGIVVATQVVEAGVDVSATTLATEAAPWASLVQRFGRCNRRGEIADAQVLWAPPPRPAPYEPEQVEAAVALLEAIEGASVGPDALEALDAPIEAPPRRHVLRRRDLLGLFDTSPDLSGLDLDVQRYIRDGDDLTVSLAWRALDGSPPSVEAPELLAAELCPVPIGELRGLVKAGRGDVWRFDAIDGTWRSLRPDELRPGDRLLTDTAFGCYTAEAGFDPAVKAAVEPFVAAEQETPEAVDSDAEIELRGAWLSIAEHSDGVCAELERLLDVFRDELELGEVAALRTAARHHDWGKVHPRLPGRHALGRQRPSRSATRRRCSPSASAVRRRAVKRARAGSRVAHSASGRRRAARRIPQRGMSRRTTGASASVPGPCRTRLGRPTAARSCSAAGRATSCRRPTSVEEPPRPWRRSSWRHSSSDRTTAPRTPTSPSSCSTG